MLFFILGMFFILLVIPIIDNLMVLLTNYVSLILQKTAKKIYDIKKEIGEDLKNSEESSPIGFQTECIGYEIDSTLNNDEDDDNE